MPVAKRPITAESPTPAATAEPPPASQTEQDARLAVTPKPHINPAAHSSSSRPQVLVYDGDCRFCVRRARWFQRRAGKSSRLKKTSGTADGQASQASTENGTAVAWQDLDLAEVGLTEDVVTREAVWIDAEGCQFAGHAAIAKSLIHIGGLWGVAGRLLRVPPISWLARLVYRVVAANRHRMPSDSA